MDQPTGGDTELKETEEKGIREEIEVRRKEKERESQEGSQPLETSLSRPTTKKEQTVEERQQQKVARQDSQALTASLSLSSTSSSLSKKGDREVIDQTIDASQAVTEATPSTVPLYRGPYGVVGPFGGDPSSE